MAIRHLSTYLEALEIEEIQVEILLADTLEKQVFGVGVVEWALVAF